MVDVIYILSTVAFFALMLVVRPRMRHARGR